jgi:hypothetical protein
MKRSGIGGILVIACVAALSGCSSPHSTGTTTSTGVPRGAIYRIGTTAVRLAFAGSPTIERNPAQLVNVLPKGTSVTTWTIGNVGALNDNSYELVVATFPPGSTTATIDAFLTTYSSAPNSTMFGNPALHELSTIPFSTGTQYSGITAFSVGRVLVMAVAFDSVKADVVRFLASLHLVSP